MHMENPSAFSNTIINDIYDLKLPITENPKMIKHFKEHNLLNSDDDLKAERMA
jgi:hypothetical protein